LTGISSHDIERRHHDLLTVLLAEMDADGRAVNKDDKGTIDWIGDYGSMMDQWWQLCMSHTTANQIHKTRVQIWTYPEYYLPLLFSFQYYTYDDDDDDAYAYTLSTFPSFIGLIRPRLYGVKFSKLFLAHF
jgi:hypothetical protein